VALVVYRKGTVAGDNDEAIDVIGVITAKGSATGHRVKAGHSAS
jgi:hypothetical protein